MEKNNLKTAEKLVVIGGSAGSLDVITKVLPKLQNSHDTAILLIVHRKDIPGTKFPVLLSRNSSWPVNEAEEKFRLQAGFVYTTPSDFHLLIEEDKTFSLDYSEKVNFSRPSIDVTMESAAWVYKENLIGILLSGANEDGVEGLAKILENGGKIYIQDPAQAILDIMPNLAVKRFNPEKVYSIEELIQVINSLIA